MLAAGPRFGLFYGNIVGMNRDLKCGVPMYKMFILVHISGKRMHVR